MGSVVGDVRAGTDATLDVSRSPSHCIGLKDCCHSCSAEKPSFYLRKGCYETLAV